MPKTILRPIPELRQVWVGHGCELVNPDYYNVKCTRKKEIREQDSVNEVINKRNSEHNEDMSITSYDGKEHMGQSPNTIRTISNYLLF